MKTLRFWRFRRSYGRIFSERRRNVVERESPMKEKEDGGGGRWVADKGSDVFLDAFFVVILCLLFCPDLLMFVAVNDA
ncbi:hypothetical protein Hanom_Chr16g01463371 [Helianthus anomalus]